MKTIVPLEWASPIMSIITLLSIPRNKRRFASAMLVLWTIALFTMWVNACPLQDHSTHLDSSTGGTAGPWLVLSDYDGDLDGGHAHDPTPAEEPCLKVCDDTTMSLVKWQSDMELPAFAMQTTFGIAWSESVIAQQTALVERPAPAGPPLRTRYVRLVL
jgi:hypothetical protein